MKAPRIAAINEVQKCLKHDLNQKTDKLKMECSVLQKKKLESFYSQIEKTPLMYMKIVRAKHWYREDLPFEVRPSPLFVRELKKHQKDRKLEKVLGEYKKIQTKIERLRLDCLLEGEAGLSKSMATITAAINNLK